MVNCSAVLYSKNNYELSYRMQKICKNNGINLIYYSNFGIVVEEIKKIKPTYLFLDNKELECSVDLINVFSENGVFDECNTILIVDDQSKFDSKSNILAIINSTDLEVGVKNILNKPLRKKIVEPCSSEICKKINKILLQLGFSNRHLGYIYLKDIVCDLLKNNKGIKSLHSMVYPKIACKYDTTVASVERNVRTAIEFAYDKVENKTIYSSLVGLEILPSNKQIISSVVENIINRHDVV
ncbi:MAG: sporulation initiation factor Spo0A C-terminal domain-containing protein [Clostridia bacterium]